MKQNKTLTTAIKNYLTKKALLDALEKDVKADKQTIEDFMDASQDTEVVYELDGQPVKLKLSEVTRTNVNQKQLQEKYPEIYTAVTYPSTYRRLNVDAKAEVQVQDGKIESKIVFVTGKGKTAING